MKALCISHKGEATGAAENCRGSARFLRIVCQKEPNTKSKGRGRKSFTLAVWQ